MKIKKISGPAQKCHKNNQTNGVKPVPTFREGGRSGIVINQCVLPVWYCD